MNTNIPVLFVVIAVALAGCAASPHTSNAREPYVKPGLIMLTADQAEYRGIQVESATAKRETLPADVEPLDSASVVVPPGIKVYTLNRAADPGDADMMHEQHVVYRRESTPQWRLDAPADQKILVGPRITDGRQEFQPLLTKELTAFLSDERRATESNQKAISALFDAVDALNRQQQTLARRELAKSSENQPPAAVDRPADGSGGEVPRS